MKKTLTFLLLFFSLNLSAQYSLDVGFGYDYPSFKYVDYEPTYKFQNGNFNGLQGHIGFQRDFNSLFTHSYGIGYLNRWTKNTIIHTSSDTVAPITTTTNVNYSFGTFQLYYLAKLYPYKKIRFALNAGVSFDRQQFVTKELDGTKSFKSESYFGLPEIIGTIGMSFDQRISEQWTLYTQLTLSRSIYFLFREDFHPVTGEYFGVTDYRLKLGVTYYLKNPPLTYKQRIEKAKTDPIRTTFFRNFDLKVFYSYSSRKLVKPESYSSGNNCGYCTDSYSTNIDKYTAGGAGFGIGFSKNILFTSFDFSLEDYSEEFISNYVVTEHHPHLPWGTIQDYYKETDVLSTSFQRIRVATSIGVKIFHPKRKINVIPSIKLVQGYVVNKKIYNNYKIRSSVYNWDGNPDPSSNYAWDSISYPSRFVVKKFNLELLVGSSFTAQISKRIQVNCDLFYGLGSEPLLINNKNPFKDRLRFYSSFGIGYRIPLADKRKIPKTTYSN